MTRTAAAPEGKGSSLSWAAGLLAGMLVALAVVQTAYWPALNLSYGDEPLLVRPVQIQSLRNLLWSHQLHFRPYFQLMAALGAKRRPFPAGAFLARVKGGLPLPADEYARFLQEAGLSEADAEHLDSKWTITAPLVRFIGSGTYDPPFPDPYRLPLVPLTGGADLRRLFPELDLSLAAVNRSPVDNLADLPVVEGEGKGNRALSLGLLLRCQQEAENVRLARRRSATALVLILALGLVCGLMLGLSASGGGCVGKGTMAVSLLIVAVGGFVLMAGGGFRRTRGIEFDPGLLSAAALAAMRPAAHRLLDRLTDEGAVPADRKAALHALIDAPPIRTGGAPGGN
ncbi:MAG: hypothetical protein GX442_05130 [Candidatus Riflebacteria bacterium]|nr:hypothetical protein [Candidatus Riflebacteria bacterium]